LPEQSFWQRTGSHDKEGVVTLYPAAGVVKIVVSTMIPKGGNNSDK